MNPATAISLLGLVASAAGIGVAIYTARRRTSIRPRLDLLRIAASIVALIAVQRIMGVSSPSILSPLALIVGFGLGAWQGSRLRIELENATLTTRRTPAAIAAWGLGLMLMQTAGVGTRAGVFSLGQTISYIGVGTLVGLFVFRNRSIERVVAAIPSAAVMVVVVAVLASPLFARAAMAGHEAYCSHDAPTVQDAIRCWEKCNELHPPGCFNTDPPDQPAPPPAQRPPSEADSNPPPSEDRASVFEEGGDLLGPHRPWLIDPMAPEESDPGVHDQPGFPVQPGRGAAGGAAAAAAAAAVGAIGWLETAPGRGRRNRGNGGSTDGARGGDPQVPGWPPPTGELDRPSGLHAETTTVPVSWGPPSPGAAPRGATTIVTGHDGSLIAVRSWSTGNSDDVIPTGAITTVPIQTHEDLSGFKEMIEDVERFTDQPVDDATRSAMLGEWREERRTNAVRTILERSQDLDPDHLDDLIRGELEGLNLEDARWAAAQARAGIAAGRRASSVEAILSRLEPGATWEEFHAAVSAVQSDSDPDDFRDAISEAHERFARTRANSAAETAADAAEGESARTGSASQPRDMTADERHRALAAGDELLSQRRHRETLGRVFQEIDGRNTWSEFDGSIDAATEGLSAGEANEIRAAASERFARERHRTNVERILSRIDSENLSDEAFDRAVGEAIEAGQMDPTEAAAATRAAYRDVSGIESWPPPDEGNE